VRLQKPFFLITPAQIIEEEPQEKEAYMKKTAMGSQYGRLEELLAWVDDQQQAAQFFGEEETQEEEASESEQYDKQQGSLPIVEDQQQQQADEGNHF
jgi:hypothetical protein